MTRRSGPLLLAPLLVALAGCELMTPPSEDPVLIKLNEIEERLDALERVVQNQSLVDLARQVSSLERQTAELTGTIETLEYNAQTTAERQRQLYLDLDARLQALEERLTATSAPSVLDGGPLPPGQLPVPGGSDEVNYRAAFELIKEQRYDAAETAFKEFLASFPDSQHAPSAQYWLAETYYVRQQFEAALSAFNEVLENYPQSRKAVDALLKVGYTNYELERWDAAKEALGRVQSDFPETTAARLAGQRLERMDEEGV